MRVFPKKRGTRRDPQGPAIAVFPRKNGTRRDPTWCTPAITRTGCVGEKKDSQGHAIAVFFGKSEIRRDLQGRNLRRFSLLLDLTALLRRPFAPTEASLFATWPQCSWTTV